MQDDCSAFFLPLGRPAPLGLLAVLRDFDLSVVDKINEITANGLLAHSELRGDLLHRHVFLVERLSYRLA
jgi:hypothetical protein